MRQELDPTSNSRVLKKMDRRSPQSSEDPALGRGGCVTSPSWAIEGSGEREGLSHWGILSSGSERAVTPADLSLEGTLAFAVGKREWYPARALGGWSFHWKWMDLQLVARPAHGMQRSSKAEAEKLGEWAFSSQGLLSPLLFSGAAFYLAYASHQFAWMETT